MRFLIFVRFISGLFNQKLLGREGGQQEESCGLPEEYLVQRALVTLLGRELD